MAKNPIGVFLLGGPGAAVDLVRTQLAGESIDEPAMLAHYYRAEQATPTKHRERFLEVASLILDGLIEDLDTRFEQLTRRGVATKILVSAPNLGVSMQAPALKAYEPQALAVAFPRLRRRVLDGELSRFSNFLSTYHYYGFCALCQVQHSFDSITPRKRVPPMNTLFEIDARNLPDAVKFVTAHEHDEIWAGILGTCSGPICRAGCLQCGTPISLRFHPSELTTWREDHMCPPCAAQQLFNLRPPAFKRHERRRFRNFQIERR